MVGSNEYTDGVLGLRDRRRLIWEIGKRTLKAKNIWIFCHENPDGDTLGCGLAVYAALINIGKEPHYFSPSRIPRMYTYLPYADMVDTTQELPSEPPEMIIVNDNAAFDRLGDAYSSQLTKMGLGPLAKTKNPHCTLVNVDHHASNEYYGDINLVDYTFGCCGELVFRAFQQLGVRFNQAIVINLYATVLTDTGRFSYGNTSYQSFQIASELILHGADPFDVVNRVYNTRTVQQVQLLSKVLATITLERELGYFYCYVTREMLQQTDTVMSDTEGVLDIMKSVADYDVCFFFKEEAKEIVRVSARSNGAIDVNQLAGRFGGGGHPAAAGFEMALTLDRAPAALAAEMRAFRDESAPKPGANLKRSLT
jgi:bifunctional oligoribonuclease and PAP phosphatase NrnA